MVITEATFAWLVAFLPRARRAPGLGLTVAESQEHRHHNAENQQKGQNKIPPRLTAYPCRDHGSNRQHSEHNAGSGQHFRRMARSNSQRVRDVAGVLLHSLAEALGLPVHRFLKESAGNRLRDQGCEREEERTQEKQGAIHARRPMRLPVQSESMVPAILNPNGLLRQTRPYRLRRKGKIRGARRKAEDGRFGSAFTGPG